jgi:hypothetical protein
MTRVGFKPTTPAFEQANTVHALDRAATVIRIFDANAPPKTMELLTNHAICVCVALWR